MKELLAKIKYSCEETDKCTFCDFWSLCNVAPNAWSEEDIEDISKAFEKIKE